MEIEPDKSYRFIPQQSRFVPMKNSNLLGKLNFFRPTVCCFFLSFLLQIASHGQQILPTSVDTDRSTPSATTHAESETDLLKDSYLAYHEGSLDVALNKANQLVALDTQSRDAHMLRANIYADQKQWDKADYDYQVVLTIDPTFSPAKFDMAELKFMQKKYDEARVGFTELKDDKDFGDFATYKVLLCDLFAPHEDAAAKDLDALNQVGGNPSYYFGNAAWDLVHNKPSDAANWLKSASRIYSNNPQKFAHYTRSLFSLGYLPIHPTLGQN
jgi:tetratricopeptide (TPR) repeat protein